MRNFCHRDLLVFFRDKATVLLSFLAEFIIVGLYLLFIRDQLVGGFDGLKDADMLTDVWMISGVLGVTSVTTAMGACGVMVEDRAKKTDRDFAVSPVGSGALLGGYMSAAAAIGLLMSFILLLLSEFYVYKAYGIRLGAGSMAQIYLLLTVISVSNAAQVSLLASFLKNSTALAACCTIVGALLGFLTGTYLPMGAVPEGVRKLIICFPVSHGVTLLRQTLMEPLVELAMGAGPAAERFEEYMGVRYIWDGQPVSRGLSFTLLLFAAGISTLLAALRFSARKR